MANTAQDLSRELVQAAPSLPLFDDPDVQAALAKLRSSLEGLAVEYAPILAKARALPEIARQIEVNSQEEYEFLMAWRSDQVAALDEEAGELLDPWAGFAHRVHRAFTGLRGLVTAETERAREISKPRLVAWDERVKAERRRLEEEARVQREAAERLARLHRGIYLFGVAVSQVAELAERKRKTDEAAAEAEKAGDAKVAAALREAAERPAEPTIQPMLPNIPPAAPPPVVMPEAPRGIAKNYKARVDNKMALIRFVAEHPEHENLLDVAQGPADKLAKAYEHRLAEIIPGLAGINDPTVRSARRR